MKIPAVRLILGALAGLSAQAPAFADTYVAPRGVRLDAYALDVALSDVSDEIEAQARLDVTFAEAGARTLDLDLCSVITAPPKDALEPCQTSVLRRRPGGPDEAAPSSLGKGMTVTAVSANGAPLRYEHRDNRLRILLPEPVRAGDRRTVVIAYHGAPADGLQIKRDAAGGRVFYAFNWPNKGRNWLAILDHVSIKAPVSVSVVAPARYQVVSNGVMASQVDLPAGLRRTTWRQVAPLPVWQIALGAAPMATHDLGAAKGVPLSLWLAADNTKADIAAIGAETRSAVEFYSERIGPYPYDKLAQVEAVGGLGALEYASAIFYNSGFIAVSHEIAHQWFGDAVTEARWDDVWLSEGFATYLALLHTEHVQGHDAFLRELRRTREGVIRYALAHPADTIVDPPETAEGRVLHNAPLVYSGGALVLHTLRRLVGDDVFWATLRLYYERHRGGHATSEDLRRAAEDVCRADKDCLAKGLDLAGFFDQWLRRGGVAQLKGDWAYDANARAVVVRLDQAKAAGQGGYRFPLAVTVAGRAGDKPFTAVAQVLVDGLRSTVSIPVEGAPDAVALDPDLAVPLMRAELTRRED